MKYQELKLKMLETPLSADVFNFNYKKLKKGERSKLMHLALRHENFDLFERIISAGVKIDTKSEDGLSILHNLILNVESEVCSIQMFDFLKQQEGVKLEKKLRVNEGSPYSEMDQRTPIELVVIKRRHHLLRVLIESSGVTRYKQKEERAVWKRVIAMDDVEAFKVLAQITPPLDVVLDDKKTLLIETYKKQAFGCLTELFSNPANLELINKADRSKHTPLMYAVLNRDMKHVSLFVQNNADVKCQTVKGSTALMYAVGAEDMECIRFLLQHGADVNEQDQFGITALMIAVRKERLDIIDFLMNAGAIVHLSTSDCRNALIFAADVNNSECVRKLLKAEVIGLDNQVGGGGPTALIIAAENDNYDIVSQLVDAGADVNIVTDNSFTVLKSAVLRGCEKSTRKLLDAGAKFYGRGKREVEHSGELSKAILGKNPEKCLELVLEARKNSDNIVDQERHMLDAEDALAVAFKCKKTECVDLLLKRKVSPVTLRVLLAAVGQIDFWTEDSLVRLVDLAKESKDFTSKNNQVVLQCVLSNHVKLLKALVNAGASIEVVDKVGEVEVENNDKALLLYACDKGNVEVLQFLLSKNTLNVNIENAYGISPLYYAAQVGSEECVNLLFQHGAKIKNREDSVPPLVAAARGGHVEVVRALLKKGADVADKAGSSSGDITAMTIAGFRGHDDVVALLYEQGRIEEQLDFNIEVAEGEDGPEIEVSIFVQEFPHYFKFLNEMYARQSAYIPDRAVEMTQRVLRAIIKFLSNSAKTFSTEIRQELIARGNVDNHIVLTNYLLEGVEESPHRQFVEMMLAKFTEGVVGINEKVPCLQYSAMIAVFAHDKGVINLEDYVNDYSVDMDDDTRYNISADIFRKLYDLRFLRHLCNSVTLLSLYRPSPALNGFAPDSFLNSKYICDAVSFRIRSIIKGFKERNMDAFRVIYRSFYVSARGQLLPALPTEISDMIVSFLLPFIKNGSVYECDFKGNSAVRRVEVQDPSVKFSVRERDGFLTTHTCINVILSLSSFKKE